MAINFREGLKNYQGSYDLIFLDHDLDGHHYVSSIEENTGYHFCKWIIRENLCVNTPMIVVHSQNQFGAINMVNLLEKNKIKAVAVPFSQLAKHWSDGIIPICGEYKYDRKRKHVNQYSKRDTYNNELNTMIRLLILFFSLLISVFLNAQVIRMDFPHFAGQEYVFSLAQAGKNDTIQRGALDEKGQTVLIVPKTYQGYRGMSQFSLANGGGLDIVLNEEKAFLIRCTEVQPNANNLFFIGSQENNRFIKSAESQRVLLERYRAMQLAKQSYSPKETLYPVFSKESRRLEEAYIVWQTEKQQKPFYAARILEIRNFLMGLGKRLDNTQEATTQELFDFVANELDMETLYTSGLWNYTLESWMNRQMERKDDILTLGDSQKMLSRTPSKEVHHALLDKLAKLYTQAGIDRYLADLGIDGLLEAGNTAPALTTESSKYIPVKSVIIFYETGCNECKNELVQLRGNYPVIQEKGYEVISVAADHNQETFETTAQGFPWKEKLCDYQGFDGVNFRNYGIIGTPTIFVTNGEGKIIGRYVRIVEVISSIQK
jgi:hypothetical protein